MVTNKDIHDTESLNKFKSKFGKLTNNKTTVSSYWNKNYVNNIKKINTQIDWHFINNINTKTTYLRNEKSIRSQSHYGFNSFEKELINVIKFDPNENILIVSNYNILKHILDRCKSKINMKNIQVSSIWKIQIEYIDHNINYSIVEKLYPTPSNFKPLEYKEEIDNKYRFIFNGIRYILFDADEIIPIEYLKLTNNKKIPRNIKNKLTKTYNVTYPSNKLISIDNFK